MAIALWKKSGIAILIPFVNRLIILSILSSVRNVGSFVVIDKSQRQLSNLLTTCNVRMENYIRMVSDCFDVTVENGIIRGRIACQCHKCTRKWRHDADHCGPRKAHILACRFGGPRWGINCWHNTIEQEFWWTAQEERLALNLPADVILDTHAVLYCVANDCKHFNESASHKRYVKKRKSLMRLTLQRLQFWRKGKNIKWNKVWEFAGTSEILSRVNAE
ncbi:uncharacterized protein LOC107265879 isoform X1 [Cephus cinctus]|uniref:Uncharacterized protein LOC107265879 isoform X1 n=1 Tax=Cephus cinctus TaxID=211228 RepID=A0AAJ7FGX2_CEPCN|nr:uncharacterized protein LOC107265879 isoform X1 [Cephus cinctus]